MIAMLIFFLAVGWILSAVVRIMMMMSIYCLLGLVVVALIAWFKTKLDTL